MVRIRQVPHNSTASERPGRSKSVQSHSRRSSLSLSEIIHMRSQDDVRLEPSVIAVPGYYTPTTNTWGIKNELQKAAASIEDISKLHWYTYQHDQPPPREFSWESFLRTGNDLAEDLAQLAAKLPGRPIIFIAHSLGGTLLKRALLLAHQNLQDPRFRLVVECLSGILFLGTPHAGTSDEDTLLRHNQILFTCAKIAVQKQSSVLPRHDAQQLSNLEATFEQIANLRLLSVYEASERPSGIQKFFARKSKTLVDERLATIHSTTEHLLGVHLSHNELCKLPMLRDQSYSARHFLRSLFQDLASQKTDPSAGTTFSTTETMIDPLNPLNLVPLETPVANEDALFSLSGISSKLETPSRSSLKLPLRLHLISNTNTDRLLATRTARLPCFMISQRPNPDFVGRGETFALIDKTILPRADRDQLPGADTHLFALCGMGGIGKTDLAVEYAFSRRKHFGAIFWLEAGGVSQLASDFGRIATQLGLESADEAENLESSIEIAKAWLTKPMSAGDGRNESWLLIFDNADNLDIIKNYIPYNANGAILVTSRDPFAKEHFFSNASGIELEPLTVNESATLLKKLISNPEGLEENGEHQAFEVLATHLDGLPLAMTQTAGLIRRRHLSIQEFIDLYATDARYAEIHDISHLTQDQRYGSTLATTFNFEGLGGLATRLLQLLAFLNPDRIQEDLFVKVHSLRDKSADEGWTAKTYESARFELLTSSIIKRNITKRELRIHRVIQTEVRTRLDKARGFHNFQEVVSLLCKLWPPGNLCCQASERWALCEILLPHLERFYQLWVEYCDAWADFKVKPDFPRLMNEAAVYLHERGFSHEGKPYLALALSLCKRANIEGDPIVSDMHLTMGALANETNDAQACLEQNILCLSLRKDEAAQQKQPSLRLAFAHSQMGIAYMMVKKFAVATEYFKQSVHLLKTINGDPDEFGFPVCNLGLAYWIQGDLDNADKTLTDLLAQRESLHGKLDKVSYKTGRVLQALANVKSSEAARFEAQGDQAQASTLWNESFSMHSDCLKQYESTLGKFNHRTADACHKLAEHCIRLGRHPEAQEYLDRALSIWGDRQWFQNESARSSFLRGTHLVSMGGEVNCQLGKRWIERAMVLRRQISPQEELRELETADFDDLVCFWSI